MKRKQRLKLKPFRLFPHIMERRMKKGYRKCGAINLAEAKLTDNCDELCEYEKWLVKQTEQL